MARIDELIARLYKSYELVYVEYDDKFDEGQIRWILEGSLDALELDLENWESDCRYASTQSIIADEFPDEEEDLTDDEQEALREALYDRDSSDPLAELARHSGGVDVYLTLLEAWLITPLKRFITNELGWPAEVVSRILRAAYESDTEDLTLTVHFRLQVSDLLEAVQAKVWRGENSQLVINRAMVGLNGDLITDDEPVSLVRPFKVEKLEYDDTYRTTSVARIETPNIAIAVEQLRSLLVETGATNEI